MIDYYHASFPACRWGCCGYPGEDSHQRGHPGGALHWLQTEVGDEERHLQHIPAPASSSPQWYSQQNDTDWLLVEVERWLLSWLCLFDLQRSKLQWCVRPQRSMWRSTSVRRVSWWKRRARTIRPSLCPTFRSRVLACRSVQVWLTPLVTSWSKWIVFFFNITFTPTVGTQHPGEEGGGWSDSVWRSR